MSHISQSCRERGERRKRGEGGYRQKESGVGQRVAVVRAKKKGGGWSLWLNKKVKGYIKVFR